MPKSREGQFYDSTIEEAAREAKQGRIGHLKDLIANLDHELVRYEDKYRKGRIKYDNYKLLRDVTEIKRGFVVSVQETVSRLGTQAAKSRINTLRIDAYDALAERIDGSSARDKAARESARVGKPKKGSKDAKVGASVKKPKSNFLFPDSVALDHGRIAELVKEVLVARVLVEEARIFQTRIHGNSQADVIKRRISNLRLGKGKEVHLPEVQEAFYSDIELDDDRFVNLQNADDLLAEARRVVEQKLLELSEEVFHTQFEPLDAKRIGKKLVFRALCEPEGPEIISSLRAEYADDPDKIASRNRHIKDLKSLGTEYGWPKKRENAEPSDLEVEMPEI